MSNQTEKVTGGTETTTAPEERKGTLYINLLLIAAIAFFLLTDEGDIFALFRNGIFVRDALLDDDVIDLKTAYHLLPGADGENGTAASATMPGRFPRLGSKEFRKQCSWTAMPGNAYRNCTIYMTPRPDGHEVSTILIILIEATSEKQAL